MKSISKALLGSAIICITSSAWSNPSDDLTCFQKHYLSESNAKREEQFNMKAKSDIAVSTVSVVVGVGALATMIILPGKMSTVASDQISAFTTTSSLAGTATSLVIGGVQLASNIINEDINNVEILRRLELQAAAGNGELLRGYASSFVQTLTQAETRAREIKKIKNSKPYDLALMESSLAEAIISQPELCESSDFGVVKVNLLNQALTNYRIKEQKLTQQ